MAFRDLRFLSTVFLAHFTRLISLFFLFPMLFYFLFSIQVPFLKKPGSSNKASRLAIIEGSLRELPGELVVPSGDDRDCVRVAANECRKSLYRGGSASRIATDPNGDYCGLYSVRLHA
jgi:hypothetical protein